MAIPVAIASHTKRGTTVIGHYSGVFEPLLREMLLGVHRTLTMNGFNVMHHTVYVNGSYIECVGVPSIEQARTWLGFAEIEDAKICG